MCASMIEMSENRNWEEYKELLEKNKVSIKSLLWRRLIGISSVNLHRLQDYGLTIILTA